MTETQIDQLVAAVRALPSAERLRVAKRVIEGLPAEDRLRVLEQVVRPDSAPAASASSMLGLFADEPELVDEVCRKAYADRATAQPRQIDE
jgi:hypothetical protein